MGSLPVSYGYETEALNNKAFAKRFKSADLEKALGRYVETDGARKILNGDFDPLGRERRPVHFVLAAIEAQNAEEYSGVTGRLTTLAMQLEGSVYGLIPISVVTFSQSNPLGEELRLLFAAEICAVHSDRVAVVHGMAEAEVGTFGSPKFMNLGFGGLG